MRYRLSRMLLLVILLLNFAAIPISTTSSDDAMQIFDSSITSTKDPQHKLNRPTWDQEPTNQTIQFTESFRYDLNATVPGGGAVWYWMWDWDHFSISDRTGVIIDNNQVGPYPYLSAGIYPLRVYAYDIVVYEAISKLIYIHVLEYAPPTIEGDNPDRTFIVGNVNTTLKWNISDPNFDKLRLYCNDEPVHYWDHYWISQNITIEYEVSDLGPGVYTYRLEAIDAVGNTAEDTVVITVNTVHFTSDTTTTTFSTSTITSGINSQGNVGAIAFLAVSFVIGLTVIVIYKIRDVK